MNKLRFVFPETDNFTEDMPRVLWQHMYGWIDGYGMLFDPVVLNATGVIPEWENGLERPADDNDFVVCPCTEATNAFDQSNLPPGIFIRPQECGKQRISEKELFENPVFPLDYPDRMAFDIYENGLAEWRIAEESVVQQRGKGLAVGFELFQISSFLSTPSVHWHERRLTVLASVLARLMETAGIVTDTSLEIPQDRHDMRIDFQAYGFNRFILQRLLLLEGQDKREVTGADTYLNNAFHAFHDGTREDVRNELKKAFTALRDIRKRTAGVEMRFVDVPHIGILLDDKAFFEFEWPRLSKDVLESYWDKIEHQNYQVAVEAGASCWEKLMNRYPEFGRRFRDRLQRSDAMELTNGTYSLPYALLSPLAMQYMQFEHGLKTFKKVFGVVPKTYQCQENSLTPQMPELLNHFGYDYAMHITQNHGSAPAENHDFIRWTSPAGCSIPAACSPADDPLGRMHRMGPIYYLFLPEVVSHFKDKPEQLYINFQDLGYVPWRVHMIRAHQYAAVWGTFQTPGKTRPAQQTTLPVKTYKPENYDLGKNVFYGDSTNVNAFSHYEDVFCLFGAYRRLKLIDPAWNSDDIEKTLCFIEAHDCSIVGGQRRGEFYAGTPDPPPYSRDTLVNELTAIKQNANRTLKNHFATLQQTTASRLYNGSEVSLTFARVAHAEAFRNTDSLMANNGHVYAVGCFPAFAAIDYPSAQAPDTITEQNWNIDSRNEWIDIQRAGKAIGLRLCDRRHGAFKCTGTSKQVFGTFTIRTFTFELVAPGTFQVVKLDILADQSSEYAELALTYAPRRDFSAADKWGDHLFLEFDCGAIENIVQFNPNVYSTATRREIVSPYCLGIKRREGDIGLLNEGAFVYCADRENQWVHWLFHVAGETVCERRMAINFGDQDNFLLARAWSAGLLPFDDPELTPFGQEVPLGISIEYAMRPGRYLISNVLAIEKTFTIPPGTTVTGLGAQTTMTGPAITLKAFETAILRKDLTR